MGSSPVSGGLRMAWSESRELRFALGEDAVISYCDPFLAVFGLVSFDPLTRVAYFPRFVPRESMAWRIRLVTLRTSPAVAICRSSACVPAIAASP